MSPSPSASRKARDQKSGTSTTTSTSTYCQVMEQSSSDTPTQPSSMRSALRSETGQCSGQLPSLRLRSPRRYSQQSPAPRWLASQTPEPKRQWRRSASPEPLRAETKLSSLKDTTTDITTTYSSASNHPQS